MQRVGLVALIALIPAVVSLSPSWAEDSPEPRKLTIDDFFSIGEVNDPQVSPDGEWIAYTVKHADLDEDEYRTRIWIVPTADGEAVPVTAEDQSSSRPRWSPDGR